MHFINHISYQLNSHKQEPNILGVLIFAGGANLSAFTAIDYLTTSTKYLTPQRIKLLLKNISGSVQVYLWSVWIKYGSFPGFLKKKYLIIYFNVKSSLEVVPMAKAPLEDQQVFFHESHWIFFTFFLFVFIIHVLNILRRKRKIFLLKNTKVSVATIFSI